MSDQREECGKPSYDLHTTLIRFFFFWARGREQEEAPEGGAMGWILEFLVSRLSLFFRLPSGRRDMRPKWHVMESSNGGMLVEDWGLAAPSVIGQDGMRLCNAKCSNLGKMPTPILQPPPRPSTSTPPSPSQRPKTPNPGRTCSGGRASWYILFPRSHGSPTIWCPIRHA